MVITKEMAADLSAQSMTTLGELGAFELALALGRAVGPEEVDGFNYGSPYMHMVGAIRSAKANKGQSLPVSDSKILVFSDESGPSASEKISRGCRPAFRHIFGFYLGAEPSEMAPQVVVVCEHVPATR